MKRQVTRLAKTVDDTLSRLTDLSRHVELFEVEAQGLNSQLSKTVKARDSAFAKSSNRQKGSESIGGTCESVRR